MRNNNKKWYSVIISILMVWFMLILSLWVFSLILKESKDTKMMESYLKAYQAAEWWIELALYEAKTNNYNLDNSKTFELSSWSFFNQISDPEINYKVSSQTRELKDKQIWSWKFHIIPLSNVKQLKLTSTNSSKLIWNIIWEANWISWVWNINNLTNWTFKTISNTFSINLDENKNVYNYLSNQPWDKYLILNNLDTANSIKYNLVSLAAEKFVKDKTEIVSSAEVNWFKQNLRVSIDNLEYLNLLKYSIYSSN